MAIQPPSTSWDVPVTYELASEARKMTAPAISGGCAQRFSAVLLEYPSHHSVSALICAVNAVSNGPGTMALTRTPRVPSAVAIVLVSCTTPALAAA